MEKHFVFPLVTEEGRPCLSKTALECANEEVAQTVMRRFNKRPEDPALAVGAIHVMALDFETAVEIGKKIIQDTKKILVEVHHG